MNSLRRNRAVNSRGFTLVELMVTLSVLAIVLAVGVPSFTEMLDKNRVKAASLALYDDIQFARSAAIRNSSEVYVSFTGSGATWCWGISEGATCSCTTANSCMVDGINKVVSSSEFTGVSLSATAFATGSSLAFEPRRGLAQNTTGTNYSGGLTFKSARDKTITTQLSIVGRVSQCSTDVGGFQTSCD